MEELLLWTPLFLLDSCRRLDGMSLRSLFHHSGEWSNHKENGQEEFHMFSAICSTAAYACQMYQLGIVHADLTSLHFDLC